MEESKGVNMCTETKEIEGSKPTGAPSASAKNVAIVSLVPAALPLSLGLHVNQVKCNAAFHDKS
jgi:hypothetical protein